MSLSKLKLYEFAEADWIVAYNLRQAVRCWKSYSGNSIREALECAEEIPRKYWSKYTFRYDEAGDRRCTFVKRIKEVLANKEESVPFFLCTSEY